MIPENTVEKILAPNGNYLYRTRVSGGWLYFDFTIMGRVIFGPVVGDSQEKHS